MNPCCLTILQYLCSESKCRVRRKCSWEQEGDVSQAKVSFISVLSLLRSLGNHLSCSG